VLEAVEVTGGDHRETELCDQSKNVKRLQISNRSTAVAAQSGSAAKRPVARGAAAASVVV